MTGIGLCDCRGAAVTAKQNAHHAVREPLNGSIQAGIRVLKWEYQLEV
jgi:hypothetical protein